MAKTIPPWPWEEKFQEENLRRKKEKFKTLFVVNAVIVEAVVVVVVVGVGRVTGWEIFILQTTYLTNLYNIHFFCQYISVKSRYI